MTKSEKAAQATVMVEDFRQMKHDAADTEDQRKLLQAEAVQAMKAAGLESLTYDADGLAVKAAVVQTERVIYNEAQLKKALGAKVWSKVTAPVLDLKLLEAAITTGLVSPVTVAQCALITPNTPYIKITEKKEKA